MIKASYHRLKQFRAAAVNGDMEEIEDFLHHFGPADIDNKGNYDSDTALMSAARWGHNDIVELLLKNGAGLEARSSDGKTGKLFKVMNDGRTPLMFAILGGHNDTVALLLKKGARVDVKDDEGYTPLTLAEKLNKKDIVEILEQNPIIREIRRIEKEKELEEFMDAFSSAFRGGYRQPPHCQAKIILPKV